MVYMRFLKNKITLIISLLLIPVAILVILANSSIAPQRIKVTSRSEIRKLETFLNKGTNVVRADPSPTESIVLESDKPFETQLSRPNTIYIIRHQFKLSSNITIPANCVLKFDRGSLSGNYVISGQYTGIEAENRLIFDPSVTIAGTWAVKEAYPIWLGARGDGLQDDTRALQNLFNLRTTCKLDNGKIYSVRSVLSEEIKHYKSTCLTLHSNTVIEGNNSMIKLGDGVLRDNNTSIIIVDDNAERITIRNLTIDGNSQKNTFVINGNYKYRCYFLMFCGGKDILIEDCNFYNCPGRNMINLCSRIRTEPAANPFAQVYENAIVRNCKFKTGGAYLHGTNFNPFQDDFSFIYSEFSVFYCYNNEIINLDLDTKENVGGASYETRKTFLSGKIPDSKTKYWSGGIEIHGNRSVVYNNKIVGCRPAIYIGSINSSFRQDNVWVYDNDCIDCSGGIELYGNDGQYGDIKITNNNLKLAYDGVALGYVRSGKDFYSNLEISNNKVYVEPNMEYKNLTGIIIPTGRNIKIRNNSLNDMNIGISFYRGAFGNVSIFDNIISAEKGIALDEGREYYNLHIENNQFKVGKYVANNGRDNQPTFEMKAGRMVAFYGLASHSGRWEDVTIKENYVDNVYTLTEKPQYDITKLALRGITYEGKTDNNK